LSNEIRQLLMKMNFQPDKPVEMKSMGMNTDSPNEESQPFILNPDLISYEPQPTDGDAYETKKLEKSERPSLLQETFDPV
jgi:hypothetical protein